MTYVQFTLICEGGTDTYLTSHLENLLIRVGADIANGSALDFRRIPDHEGRDVESKLETAMREDRGANLFLIHRDADDPDPEPRYEEIEAAVESVGLERENVAVVPVQETEAWLLLDEEEIKYVAGNPNNRDDLALPGPHDVEDVTSPKERLREAILQAADETGYRRDRVRSRLPRMKAQLLRRLSAEGPIQEVPAWQRLRGDLEAAIEYL